jgi:hypothetical protein
MFCFFTTKLDFYFSHSTQPVVGDDCVVREYVQWRKGLFT